MTIAGCRSTAGSTRMDIGALFANAWLAPTWGVLGIRLVRFQPHSRLLTGKAGKRERLDRYIAKRS